MASNYRRNSEGEEYEAAGDAGTEDEYEEEGDDDDEDIFFDQFDSNPHKMHRKDSYKEPMGERVVRLLVCEVIYKSSCLTSRGNQIFFEVSISRSMYKST